MIIRSRAPLRLGLAGGGTDISPYCDRYGGAVLNATIGMFAYCTIIETDDGKAVFNATDLEASYSIDSSDMDSVVNDKRVQLHVGVYRRIVKQFLSGRSLSFIMYTDSDAFIGSGLGGSSTLVVAILKCFVEWLNLPLGEYDIAHLAWEIERLDLALSGGKQDQYAATFGGVNFIEFGENKVIVNPLRIKRWILCELENSLLLYFTGKSRESAHIIEQQRDAVKGHQDRLLAMHDIKTEAYRMKEALLTGNFGLFAESLQFGWLSKKKTSDTISNPEIDEIYDSVMKNGGIAGKLSGAGGGGFFMFYIDSKRRRDIYRVLEQFGGCILSVQLYEHGTRGWILP